MLHSQFLVPFFLLSTALMLPAQWVEVGDAGSLPTSAQVPIGPPVPLLTIAGVVAGDADMYLIEINAPGAFSATTVGGAAFDTQLFLFEQDGLGVTFNDDSVGLLSTLTAAFVTRPGRYYLAISAYDHDANAKGAPIWLDVPFAVERAPDGPSRKEAVDAWAGAGGGGAYLITLTGCSFPKPQILLPDYEHLCESPTQLSNGGSVTWWRGPVGGTGGRFQVIWEASHFTGLAGVAGPIPITKLMFRGEDGEPNAGGQMWPGVIVQLGSTSIPAAGMFAAFAMNTAAVTTLLGPIGVTPVTVLPSRGTTPNDYNIIIDLTAIGAVHVHDPTGPMPNLLIDITMPFPAVLPPVSGPMMAMQDAIGAAAVVRGAGVTTAAPGAAVGALSAFPPVVAIEHGAMPLAGGFSTLIPARNEYYGGACGGSPSTVYQTFLQGQKFDLTGLTFTPDVVAAPTVYTVTAGAGAFDPTKLDLVPDSIADDALVAHPLGFAFAYPGGVTAAIGACTNGYVWLDPAMVAADFTPSVSELLGVTVAQTARFLPCWYDFHCGRNVATSPLSGLHVITDVAGGVGAFVCYVTWFDVGDFNSVSGVGIGGHSVRNFQLVMYEATGVVEFRYGTTMPTPTGANTAAAIVGFTRGRIATLPVIVPSVDPQSRDLSIEVPYTTMVEVAGVNNMGQTASALPDAGGAHYSGRMFPGQVLTWNVNNIPAGTLLGVQLLDIGSVRPGLGFPPFLIASPCMLSVTPATLLWEVDILPTPTQLGTVPLVIPPGFAGTELFAQYVVLDGLFGGPSLITVASNALKHTIGLD
ncbi:MAG TPA: DVUA0089 family protein [Planctomycetota bacterium]|nr:DVUA0089 family protein [Planctomycetota bacterium]